MEFQLSYFKCWDDVVKVLHSICQQIWKTQQWPQDWKRSLFIPIQRKAIPKNVQTTAQLHSSHTLVKWCSKIFQTRLQEYMKCELPDVQGGFRKGRGTRDQIVNNYWIIEKAREFQKNIYFCFIDYAKAVDCVDHNKLWKILSRDGNIHTTWPPFWEICMQVRKQQLELEMEQQTGSK